MERFLKCVWGARGRDSSCDENLERSVSCPVSRLGIQGRGPPCSAGYEVCCGSGQSSPICLVDIPFLLSTIRQSATSQTPFLKSPDFSPIIFEIFGWFISRKRPKVQVKKSMSNKKNLKKKKKKKKKD